MSETETIVVLDTETTGLDPAEGAALLELAWVPLELDPETGAWTYGHADYALIRHDGPIPPEARAVHHIGPADVAAGAEGVTERDAMLGQILQAETPELIYCAHNRKFDAAFLPELASRMTICTFRVARHLWPEAPSHANQVLRYWLGAEPPASLLRGLAPHRGLYDAAVTSAILLRALETHTPDQLARLTAQPLLLRTCQFRKHRGTPWAEVPKDYLRWMRREGVGRDDEDLQHTIDHYLG